MGETHGWFEGVEVEHTQHYGEPTIFFSRFYALRNEVTQPHVFIAIINPKFFEAQHPGMVMAGDKLGLTLMYVEAFLQQGKKVTIEARPDQAIAEYFMQLRVKYPKNFFL